MKESISLFYREGGSDKVYHAHLEPVMEVRWIVTFEYGRRGSTLTRGAKTSEPVPYAKAKQIYDKLVASKLAKGYTPYEGGTPYAATDKAGQVSGILPQLLNPIEESSIEEFLINGYIMQEKHDGRRLLIRKHGDLVEGINRRGLVVAIPEPIRLALAEWDGDFIMDGEAVGDVYHAFDLIEGGSDLRQMPYAVRLTALMNMLAALPVSGGAARFVEFWNDEAKKRRALDELRARGAEGVVFKNPGAPYTVGRPNSGGTQLKLKFYCTCTVAVELVNDQRSVKVCMPDGPMKWVTVGNVTIPPNQPMPKVGQAIEVRYLYAHRGGSLYQPTCLGIRSDKGALDADDLSMLKFKASAEDTEEEVA